MATPFTRHVSVRFRAAQAFYTGQSTSSLVPDVFPVALNGRPYLIDKKANYIRGFDPRVRDSVDQSTAPGEAAISPQGLWRRGETSWHYGSGQNYADTADHQDFRMYTSKGINPWEKGQVSLLNATALNTGTSAPTTSVGQTIIAGGKIYVIDGTTLKYTTTVSGNWSSVSMPTGTTAINALATDGTWIYAAITASTSGVYSGLATDSPPTLTRMVHDSITNIGYVNGRLMCSALNVLYDGTVRAYTTGNIAAGDTLLTHRNTAFRWVGFAGAPGYIYAAGFAGETSLIYKTTIKTDGTSLDAPSVAAQLPLGEIVSSIDSYLGFVFIGSNKGVRMATVDATGGLSLGSIIPTTGAVKGFTADGRFVWYTYTNYDGTSGGLGRLDLSVNTATNTPAFATDLMYDSTASVLSVATFTPSSGSNVRVFTISGIGFVYENTSSLVSSGELVTGIYRWGIPDRKFVAKFDTRSEPLAGTIVPSVSLDGGSYLSMTGQINAGSTESVSQTSQSKFIESQFKLTLTRATATTGPTLTSWMARVYASPARSQVFRVPLVMQRVLQVKGSEYFFNVETELTLLRSLVTNPLIVNYQEANESFSVIVEDVEFQTLDAYDLDPVFEGTATVTMRSVVD